MGMFLLIVGMIFVGVPLVAMLLVWSQAANDHRELEERKLKREAMEAAMQFELALVTTLMGKRSADWPYQDRITLEGENGLIGLNGNGTAFCLARYHVAEDEAVATAEETFKVHSIKSITVDQPTKTVTRTHTDRTPVAVQSQKKSPIGRALVGGVVAGPIGAVVGGLSGVGASTEVQYHNTQRSETVTVKGDAVLVIGLADFRRPVLRLKFEDNKVLNEWSRRLWAARGW